MSTGTTPPTPLAAGDEVELSIDSLAAGGDGVGRLADGRVVFVPLTAPGDRVRARVLSLRSRFARAEPTALLAPGPGRTEPHCGVFGECGGCQWQHLDYPTQCAAKRRIAEDALRRVGGFELPGPLELVASPVAYGYRARARVAVAGKTVGFRRRKSHALCAVRACPVLEPAVEARLAKLADAAPERDGEWELTADGARPLSRRGGRPRAIEVEGDLLRASPGVFFQGHAGLHGALRRAVAEAAGQGGAALELHSGVGFFTLPLARSFARVVAVESDRAAVADLRHNLRRAGIEGVEVRAERVELALRAPELAALSPDAVVLDPPRTGLAPGDPEALAALGPRRIVYLSCDPATQARDLRTLAEAGYGLDGAKVFDLFPQTSHVEVLAWLSPHPPR